jgi:hypothetical protein
VQLHEYYLIFPCKKDHSIGIATIRTFFSYAELYLKALQRVFGISRMGRTVHKTAFGQIDEMRPVAGYLRASAQAAVRKSA